MQSRPPNTSGIPSSSQSHTDEEGMTTSNLDEKEGKIQRGNQKRRIESFIVVAILVVLMVVGITTTTGWKTNEIEGMHGMEKEEDTTSLEKLEKMVNEVEDAVRTLKSQEGT